MTQIIQNFRTGEFRVVDVPRPALRTGGALVQNEYSLIGLGTEGSTVKTARQTLRGQG
jgi:hypothetical protein